MSNNLNYKSQNIINDWLYKIENLIYNVKILNAQLKLKNLINELNDVVLSQMNLNDDQKNIANMIKNNNDLDNELNRAVKEITEKTTTQIIAERVLQEAKILLKHSAWSVSEIAYALGFNEVSHFNNFFKKHVQLSPLKFRNV